ncbi:hypothetical protein MASR1M32_27170 [Rhodobacter sp.]
MALGAVVSAIEASLPGWPLMILARAAEGVSHLTIVVVGPTMIAGLAPEARRPFAMTLWSSFFGVTYAILGPDRRPGARTGRHSRPVPWPCRTGWPGWR